MMINCGGYLVFYGMAFDESLHYDVWDYGVFHHDDTPNHN